MKYSAAKLEAAKILQMGVMLFEMAKIPFIVVGAVMRFFVGVGQGSIRFVLNSVLFLIGFGFIAMLVFGLGRVIFYPLFH